MTDNIVRPTSAQAVDAIVADGEFLALLEALTKAGQAQNPTKLGNALMAVDKALRAEFGNPPLEVALSAIAHVAANQLAFMVMQVQRAAPISDAGRDGRVKAVMTFVQRLVERSVTERVMAERMDATAAKQLKKINARLQ